MASRHLKLILPDLTNKTHSQDERQSIVNIPNDRSSHNSAATHLRDKWKLKQSYVQKAIPQKKQKFSKPIQATPTTDSNIIRTCNAEQNMFFTGINNSLFKSPICNEQLQSVSIQKSKQFVDIIKSHRKKFLKIGIGAKPRQRGSSIAALTPKDVESKELFNYLQRNFINHKNQSISNCTIERFKTQSPQRIFEKIQEKSRKFLLEKMHKDYRNYIQIDNYKRQSIKALIQSEIQRKKKEFGQDYSKRHCSPYFSFLSLNSSQKMNVLLRRQLKSLNSI